MIDPDDYLEESDEDIFDLADEAYDRKRLEDHEKHEALLYERDWEKYRETLKHKK